MNRLTASCIAQNLAQFNELMTDFAALQHELTNPINQLSQTLWARSVRLSWQLLEVSEKMEKQAKGASHV